MYFQGRERIAGITDVAFLNAKGEWIPLAHPTVYGLPDKLPPRQQNESPDAPLSMGSPPVDYGSLCIEGSKEHDAAGLSVGQYFIGRSCGMRFRYRNAAGELLHGLGQVTRSNDHMPPWVGLEIAARERLVVLGN